jgi:hypothetical protein
VCCVCSSSSSSSRASTMKPQETLLCGFEHEF